MTVNLLVVVRVQPGLGHLQEQAFARLAPLVRHEAGCLRYDLHRVEDDPDTFILFEEWESQHALDAHDRAPHMVAQDAANKTFRVGPATVLRVASEPVA